MSELLTTKQLQDLLKIDRITVYRMLNDGRLNGVKIGNHWRFPESEVNRLLGVNITGDTPPVKLTQNFPSDCVKEVLEIFAGIIGIGAITITAEGKTLTLPTFCNPFCKMILSTDSGSKACQDSWRRITLKTTGNRGFQICHAGLSYMRSSIQTDNGVRVWLMAGQYYLDSPDPVQEAERVERLAKNFNLPPDELKVAARKIPVLNIYQQKQVEVWTPKVAGTVESMICERNDLLGRLQRISELTSINPTLSK